jgi:hypothetical protein
MTRQDLWIRLAEDEEKATECQCVPGLWKKGGEARDHTQSAGRRP